MPTPPIDSYDAIIFDLDGTLVHSAPDLLNSANHVLSLAGRSTVELSVIETGISYGAVRMMSDAFAATGGSDGIDFQAHLPAFLAYYEDHIADSSHLYNGARDLLMDLQQAGIPAAVCTNKSERLGTKLLDALDIRKHLTAMTGGDSFPVKKPDPLHLINTRNLMGMGSESIEKNVLMVGDSQNDILAAQRAGWDSAVVTFGYSELDVRSLKATYIIDCLTELRPLMGLSG